MLSPFDDVDDNIRLTELRLEREEERAIESLPPQLYKMARLFRNIKYAMVIKVRLFPDALHDVEKFKKWMTQSARDLRTNAYDIEKYVEELEGGKEHVDQDELARRKVFGSNDDKG